MSNITVVGNIEVLSTGTTKLTVTTTSDDMPAAVFAIEVMPTSRDKTCSKYRFSHICSMQELVEFPDQEDPDMCYFRTDDIEMLFDRAQTAVDVLREIRADVERLVTQYNIANDPPLLGSTVTISGATS